MKTKMIVGTLIGCIAMSVQSTATANVFLEMGITSPSGCAYQAPILAEPGGPKFQLILGELIGKSLLLKEKCPDAHISVHPFKKIVEPPK